MAVVTSVMESVGEMEDLTAGGTRRVAEPVIVFMWTSPRRRMDGGIQVEGGTHGEGDTGEGSLREGLTVRESQGKEA